MTGMFRRSRHRLSGLGRDDRGAVAVEAGLILPLLFLMVFGMIEFGLWIRDSNAATHSVRAGVRVASALPRTATLGTDSVQAIAVEGTALPHGSIEEVWIYEANDAGFPLGATDFAACNTSCLRYEPSDDGQTFTLVGGSWDPTTINACPGDPDASSVGVYLRAEHEFVTGALFQGSSTINETATMRFEPIPTHAGGSCR